MIPLCLRLSSGAYFHASRHHTSKTEQGEGERKHEGSAAKKRRVLRIEESVSEFLSEVKKRICQECGSKPGANSTKNSSSSSSSSIAAVAAAAAAAVAAVVAAVEPLAL